MPDATVIIGDSEVLAEEISEHTVEISTTSYNSARLSNSEIRQIQSNVSQLTALFQDNLDLLQTIESGLTSVQNTYPILLSNITSLQNMVTVIQGTLEDFESRISVLEGG